MNPEDIKVPEGCPCFGAEEQDALKQAGFGALMPFHYARFRQEQIENITFRSKLFLRKQTNGCQLFWVIILDKATDQVSICKKTIRQTFQNTQAALDWLGAFAGQRAFPVPAQGIEPASGRGFQAQAHSGADIAQVIWPARDRESSVLQ